MRPLISLVAGTVFGFGLSLSGMTNPARVRGFLDLLGNWDPTLAFVMGGALVVMGIAWLVQKRMQHPLADPAFHLPGTTKIDRRLIGGAVLFGAGWGLAGLCPGPAIASLATALPQAAIFTAAMLAGMALVRLLERD